MLELRPTCEHCNTALPPASTPVQRRVRPDDAAVAETNRFIVLVQRTLRGKTA